MLKVAEREVDGFYNPFPDRPQMTREWSTARTRDLGPASPERLPAGGSAPRSGPFYGNP
jgi:hypothetical protein